MLGRLREFRKHSLWADFCKRLHVTASVGANIDSAMGEAVGCRYMSEAVNAL